MKTKFRSGNAIQVIDYTPVADVSAGDVITINGILYFARLDIAAGELGSLVFAGGVWNGAKKSGSITAGDVLYWKSTEDPVDGDAGSGAFTTSSSGAVYAGVASKDAASDDEEVEFVKNPASTVSNTVQTMLTSDITDPGASGAIPVTSSGHVSLVTAAAETRTLAAPAAAGELLALTLKTDGGDCVITVATTINQTGNNTITLNNAGDTIVLVGKYVGSSLKWSVVSNDGADLTTV